MFLTFTLPDETLFSLTFFPDTIYSIFCSMISAESGVPVNQLVLEKDGKPITSEPSQTLRQIGLKENDLIAISSKPNHTSRNISSLNPGEVSSTQEDNFTETVRQKLIAGSSDELAILRQRNPELIDALHSPDRFRQVFNAQRKITMDNAAELQRLTNADQFDLAAQQRIEELIQQRNIDTEMETAMEHYPETFGQVTMLYIQCEVNGLPVKAFVDSGAQTTIMSLECAQRCNLERLIDKRWAGMAYGVGTQTIIGRVHTAELKLAGHRIPSSFVVLQYQPMDLMIGLDMLKRHHCCIDLRQNVLKIGETLQVPFLPESELPLFAKHPELGTEPSNSNITPIPKTYSVEEEVKITLLTSQNIPRERAISLLTSNNWDPNEAYNQHLTIRK